MHGSAPPSLAHLRLLTASLLFLWLVSDCGFAQTPAPVGPAPLVLDLPAARHLALERQPALAAARASLAAATQAKLHALQSLGKLVSLLRKDLPIRQQQAYLGVQAAEARLHQLEWETLYSVARCYWTVVHAQAQLELADKALDDKADKPFSLRFVRKSLEEARRGKKDMDRPLHIQKWAVEQMDVLILTMEGRREEARQGVQRALAALREAIGIDPGCSLAVTDQQLPEGVGVPPPPEIVALALARRDELTQARLFAEVCQLEVQAQCLINNLRADTFAAGTDLHALPLPSPSYGEDYHPGPIGIEMPISLVGSRCARIEQAQGLHGRALGAFDKLRGLIALDAENAALQWLEAREKLSKFEEAAGKMAEQSEQSMELLTRDPAKTFTTAANVVESFSQRVLLRMQANHTRFHMVIHLAGLERVTAGGYCPQYRPGPPNGNGKDAGKNEK